MEENKFEKQVQQKMDELQIQPSEAVWKKIELQIGKKKGRRWGLIVLFTCICALLAGSYWLWNGEKKIFLENRNSTKNTLEKNSKTSPTIKENKIVQQQMNAVSPTTIKKNNDAAKDEEKGNTKQQTLFNNSRAKESLNSDDNSATTFPGSKKMNNEMPGKIVMGSSSAESSQDQTEIENVVPGSLIKKDEKVTVDTLPKKVVLDEITKLQDTSKPHQTNNETVKNSDKNKWKFGALFVAGISGAGKDFLSLNAAPVLYDPGALNSTGQPRQAFSSSGTKAGFGFITGVSAEKNISRKIKFVSGINFKSFSTSLKLYDSAGTYYARTPSNKYVNHFNFIEVPLSLKFQVGNGKHLPLSWQAGITMSQLISSNALQLNSSTGYYYKDNSLFNKTQIGFNTAFLFTLFSKQKNPILIGPYLYYDATQIANQGLYNKKHLVFTGLFTQIIFGK